ncbi:TIGR01212 family radical SAM protein [Elusimicrobiota bacterium]
MEENKEAYYRFSKYLRDTFGSRIYRISLDAGFNCPNRDGSKGTNGCIYCDNKGFSYNTRQNSLPLEEQVEKGMEFARIRYKADKFIIYFQAYTNTYAPVKVLKSKYDIINEYDDVVGLSVSTRPDCIDDQKLDLLNEYTRNYEVWLEYGLQSTNNKTLEFINRNHSYEDFLEAVELTRQKGNFKICAHVIIGLPGEEKSDVINTAKELGRLQLDGIKIHPLHVIKGTRLEEIYNNKQCRMMEVEEYMDLVIEFLEHIHPDTVIHRITADCPDEYLVAPQWISEKNMILQTIDKKMLQEDRYQGKLCV